MTPKKEKALAALLNISYQAVSKWEAGISLPTVEMLYDIAKILNIKVRNVGEEPIDMVTTQNNRSMQERLPLYGIEFMEIKRKEMGAQVISASRVRKCLENKDIEGIRELVPETTYEYLVKKYS